MTTTRLVLEVLRWSVGVWLLWHVARCRAPGAADERLAAATSVVIPARDEEATLPRLLASLAAQRPPPAQVIVVDDHSGDATTAVARHGGATVVRAAELPPGWTGKTWACWTGAGVASSPVLAFLDADTEVEPGGLAAVLGEHRRRGGLVSVAPDHITRRPYEQLSAFFNVVAMMGLDAFDPLRRRRAPRGAFGPCLVTTADDYWAVGGHRAVRADVVEDVALARRYTAAGRPVTCLGGRGAVRFRMYPAGVFQLIEGWTKNFAGGAGSARPLTFLLVSVWLSGCISAAWYPGAAVLGRGPLSGAAAGVLYAAYAGQLAWMLGRIGRFPPTTAALYPIALGFFLVVFARSLVLTYARRQVTWRGRTIDTGRRRRKPAQGRRHGEHAAQQAEPEPGPDPGREPGLESDPEPTGEPDGGAREIAG